jgi:iron complex outermembrane receptor protein
MLDGRIGDFALHADGFERHADDYGIPGGTLGNSFFRGSGYSAGSSYFFGANRLGAAVVHYDSRYGIPGEDNYIDMRQTKEMLRASFAPLLGAWHTLNVDGGHADYEHSERAPDGTAESTFKDREWDARAEALFDAVGPFSAAALGGQMRQRSFSALGAGADYLRPTTTRSAAAFAFGDAPLSTKLHLHTGLRVESVRIDGTPADDVGVSRSFTPVSASVGLLLNASDSLRWGLTFSSAARAPAQTELFARGPHDGPGTFETGDANLAVERANSLEATLRIKRDAAIFEGALWGAKFDHFIYGALTGRSCDEAGTCVPGDSQGLQELDYRQGGAKFWGAEGKLTFNVYESGSGTLQAAALADYVRATLDSGDNVPRISPWHVGGGLTWARDELDAGFMVRYTGRQNDVAAAETPTAGFVSLDAQAAWRPFAANPGIEFALVGRNLTDTEQRNALALNKDVVVPPGREVRVMVRARL